MSVTVIDASALAAVVFDEPEAAPVLASVSGTLIAPTLIRYEVASVCVTKMLRRPERIRDIEARYRLLDEVALDLFEPDWDGLPSLAHRWHLSAYDAAYLQLALGRDASLITLDSRLAQAADALRPS